MSKRTLGLAAAVGLAYGLDRIGRRWNVSNSELAAVLPGDELVPKPMWASTRGTTIAASVTEVWPWIVQMGFPAHRAGWYTPYLLDRLTFGIREHSTEEVRPELQHVEVGDRIPDSLDWTQAHGRAVRAKLLAAKRDFDAAERDAREAVEYSNDTDDLDMRAIVLISVAEVLGLAGHDEEAKTALEEAADASDRKGNVVRAKDARARLAELNAGS